MSERKCNKCGKIRTEEEYYTLYRKVCVYCDRERAKQYKRAHSKSWKGEKQTHFKPVKKRVKNENGYKIVRVLHKRKTGKETANIPESVRAHVKAIERCRRTSEEYKRTIND